MKTTLRIPTAKQYAYIEVEFEGDAEGAVHEYHRLTSLIKGEPAGIGLPDKEWRDCLDAYLNKKPFDFEGAIDRLNASQRFALNEIKKSRVRTNPK